MSFLRAVALAERFPHDFTIQYPPRREFFQERYRGQPVLAELPSIGRLLLYIHVPFCEAKCHYCNFAVDTRQDPSLHDRYVEALLRQLARLPELLPQGPVIAGIDIGGGTPTLLKPALLERLLEGLRPWRERAQLPWPVSIETTPRIASDNPGVFALLAQSGVDRISMGLQSTSAEVLTGINRGLQARRQPMRTRTMCVRLIAMALVYGFGIAAVVEPLGHQRGGAAGGVTR